VPFIFSKWLLLIAAIVIGLAVLVPLGFVLGLIFDATMHLTGPSVPLSLGGVLVLILLQTVLPLVAGSIAIMGAVLGRSGVAGIIAGIVWFLFDSLLGGVVSVASLTSSIGVVQAQLTGAVMNSNGSVTSVHLGGSLAGPLAIIPALVVIFYLIVPIAVAAFLFHRRDMVGAS
jgi:hypothetical protein